MRIIDGRTGSIGVEVSTPEEAVLALSAKTEERLAQGLRHLWHFVHPDDAAVDSDDNEDDERKQRTVLAVAEQRPGVLGAALSRDDRGFGRHGWRWSRWNFRFDPFTDTNAAGWPRPVSELRDEAALADATLGELAAHLNAGLRSDVAALLRDCADFVHVGDEFGDRDKAPQTLWDRFRSDSDLYELDLAAVAEAIASGPPAWDALDDWTPVGGVDGDPYAVCRYGWGPLRARVELTPAELVEQYLAGDAALTLYRMVLDYGDGPTEFIWPDQTRICCGFEIGAGDVAAPIRVHAWGRPGVYLSQGGRSCRICGTPYFGRLLTKRQLDSDETAILGVSETLEELPAATLTAIARDGADAIACELRR
ncbi:MAG: hypothetical protein OXI26_07495 [bacterium]|nr:hypothetical protein [bacterium]